MIKYLVELGHLSSSLDQNETPYSWHVRSAAASKYLRIYRHIVHFQNLKACGCGEQAHS